MKSCLVDTGILYALFAGNDVWHERAKEFVNAYPGRLILPACVIPEAAFLANKYLGARAEAGLVAAVAGGAFFIEDLKPGDYARAAVLMAQHERLNIGFVDAAIAAISERLKLADIATTDRRHFSAIRPSHRTRLNLLPDA